MLDTRKIHFINRIDNNNAGDWACCPLIYYYDYFCRYNVIRHDIGYIDWNVIEKDDVVILGGGGIVNVTSSFNESINKLLDRCDNVIAWSIGFNTHSSLWSNGEIDENIQFDKLLLLTIRDYNHPSSFPYLPDPSALAVKRYYDNRSSDYKSKCDENVGVIEHKDLPLPYDFEYEKITNAYSLDDILEFIDKHSCILTNSYHVAYWTELMGKKVVVLNKFSDKFEYFRTPSGFVQIADSVSEQDLMHEIEVALSNAKVMPGLLKEAIDLNNEFFKSVRCRINALNLPRNNDYQTYYNGTKIALWNIASKIERISIIENRIDELCRNLNNLHDELYDKINSEHVEIYSKFDAEHKELCGIINDLHDEMYANEAQIREALSQKVDLDMVGELIEKKGTDDADELKKDRT